MNITLKKKIKYNRKTFGNCKECERNESLKNNSDDII